MKIDQEKIKYEIERIKISGHANITGTYTISSSIAFTEESELICNDIYIIGELKSLIQNQISSEVQNDVLKVNIFDKYNSIAKNIIIDALSRATDLNQPSESDYIERNDKFRDYRVRMALIKELMNEEYEKN